jgi:hypothetical protein
MTVPYLKTENRAGSRIVRIVVLAAALTLALAATAGAAVKISAFTATPASTQAGGHTNFTVHLAFDRSSTGNNEHPNSLVLHLPAGLIGNPTAAASCSIAAFNSTAGCPAASQVGTSSITATAQGGVAVAASGTISVLDHAANETARLGVVLTTTGAGGLLAPAPIRSQAVVSVRTGTDDGLDSTIVGLPETAPLVAGSSDVILDSLDLTLNASAANGPFETNPTSCGVQTTSVDVVSYEDPGTVTSASSAYAATGCDALPFAPKVSVTVSGAVHYNGRPTITASVLQGPGQASARHVMLTLPLSIEPDIALTNQVACTLAQQAQNACPASSIVGTATAITSLLPMPLTGPVYILQTPSGYPALRITLEPLGITVTGTSGLDTQKLTTTFDNLPDTPLSSFALTLNGGKSGVFQVGSDLCTGRTQFASGSFVGQNGATAASTAAVAVQGCQPEATASLRGFGTKKARLLLTVKAVRGGAGFTGVRVTLPPRLTLPSRLRGSQLTSTPPSAVGVKRSSPRVLLLTLPKTGEKSVRIVLKAGVLHSSPHGSRRIAVRTTDTTGAVVSQTITAVK